MTKLRFRIGYLLGHYRLEEVCDCGRVRGVGLRQFRHVPSTHKRVVRAK